MVQGLGSIRSEFRLWVRKCLSTEDGVVCGLGNSGFVVSYRFTPKTLNSPDLEPQTFKTQPVLRVFRCSHPETRHFPKASSVPSNPTSADSGSAESHPARNRFRGSGFRV